VEVRKSTKWACHPTAVRKKGTSREERDLWVDTSCKGGDWAVPAKRLPTTKLRKPNKASGTPKKLQHAKNRFGTQWTKTALKKGPL